MEPTLSRIDASHRDPSSHVYQDSSGNIIRKISPAVKQIIQSRKHFTTIRSTYDAVNNLYEVTKIPFISFYYEYPFDTLKDMALFYLDVLEDLLKDNYALSDGTPFNCTYLGQGRFEFFDLGSVIPFDSTKGWEGYRQFLIEFYFQLVYLSDLHSVYPGALVPFINDTRWMQHVRFSGKQRRRLPNIIFNSFIRKSFRNDLHPPSAGKAAATVNSNNVVRIIAFLRSAIKNTDYKKPKTRWDDYYSNTILKDYIDKKEQLFKNMYAKAVALTSSEGISVDWGANTGHFSRLMSAVNPQATIIAVESDHNAVSELYRTTRQHRIIPVHSTLFNPTPALGFEYNRESLLQRLRQQTTIQAALGLIHHMQHELNLSYGDILKFFFNASRNGSYLIVEYIDPADDRYRLIRNPNYPFAEGIDAFTTAIEDKFEIIERAQPIPTRELFFLKKKD